MPLDPLAANMQLEEQQTIAKVTKTTVDIWNYKGVGQLQTVKIFKDLRNGANRRENVRIRKNPWAVEIGGLCKHVYSTHLLGDSQKKRQWISRQVSLDIGSSCCEINGVALVAAVQVLDQTPHGWA